MNQLALDGFESQKKAKQLRKGPGGHNWNPWHGCHKFSDGCLNCYVYRIDARHDRDASQVYKTRDFDLPVRRTRAGDYKIPPGETVWTCFSSDFLLDTADEWRPEAWQMMRERSDLYFFFITKRIHRLSECLPPDWGRAYPNVAICSTTENQACADIRLPILKNAPIQNKSIACEPLLGHIDLSEHLGPWVTQVVAGGESGPNARICRYEWIKSISDQCRSAGVSFKFRQTGANFEKDGHIYKIPRKSQFSQARRAGLDYYNPAKRAII